MNRFKPVRTLLLVATSIVASGAFAAQDKLADRERLFATRRAHFLGDSWPYGIEPNRSTLQALAREQCAANTVKPDSQTCAA